jgi:thiamine kinase-like enzyme|tara:strand:- start:729 stop:1337 length:609 start_codon:yes stop_codon:yes gene_type:complete
MNGDLKIGKLLCDEDIITKRQLNQALQAQIKGDKRTLGEILVDKGFCSLDDITEVIMETAEDHDHDVVQEEIVEKIEQVSAQVAEPKELSEEAVMNTKFTLSVQTMVGAGMGLASLIGMWYTLQGDIQEAKELPSLETLYQNEYPSRPEGHNWPRSYEQYKTQVGSLQEDMDDVYDTIEEVEELIKDLRKEISSLEKRKRDK